MQSTSLHFRPNIFKRDIPLISKNGPRNTEKPMGIII